MWTVSVIVGSRRAALRRGSPASPENLSSLQSPVRDLSGV
jgi:hypothetical protein